MTLPTLTVLLDDGTGTFPLNVSSKVMALDGYDITRGREDWQGAVTAGELSLTLNNSDGRFTPGSTILGTPSPIKVDQKIRLKETVNGVTFTRFTGYVKSWPVAWPATVTTFSTVQVSATDAQARAERRTLRSMVEEETLSASPTAYYTLGEAEGSVSAGDTSGNRLPPMTITGVGTAPVFGADVGLLSAGTGVTFAGGQYLSGNDTTSLTSFGFVVATQATTQRVIIGGGALAVTVEASGKLSVFMVDAVGGTSVFILSTAVINDGAPHAAFVVIDGAVARLYIDGVADNTVGLGGSGVVALTITGIGGGSGLGITPILIGSVAHVAGFTSILSPTQVANISTAALNGFAGETVAARLTRIAGYSGIPVGTLDSSSLTLAGGDTNGQSAMQAIQEVIDAEFGLAFIDGNGALTFHNRSAVAGTATPDLTLDRQWVTPEVLPVVDDQQIINYFEATAAGTGGVQVAADAASEVTHGRYTSSSTYLVQTDAEALDRARWIVGNFAEPSPRYGTLTINLYGMTPALASTVLTALDLNCWLRVTSLASQNPGGTTADVVVQGWRESVTAESWSITCNVVARSLYNAWILGSSTYGVLGSTTKLYV
jgi:hypothetical protein